MPKEGTWLAYFCVFACILKSGLSPEKKKKMQWLRGLSDPVVGLKEKMVQGHANFCDFRKIHLISRMPLWVEKCMGQSPLRRWKIRQGKVDPILGTALTLVVNN